MLLCVEYFYNSFAFITVHYCEILYAYYSCSTLLIAYNIFSSPKKFSLYGYEVGSNIYEKLNIILQNFF